MRFIGPQSTLPGPTSIAVLASSTKAVDAALPAHGASDGDTTDRAPHPPSRSGDTARRQCWQRRSAAAAGRSRPPATHAQPLCGRGHEVGWNGALTGKSFTASPPPPAPSPARPRSCGRRSRSGGAVLIGGLAAVLRRAGTGAQLSDCLADRPIIAAIAPSALRRPPPA